jgi:hypothetical protein
MSVLSLSHLEGARAAEDSKGGAARGARPKSREMIRRVGYKEEESVTYGPRPMIAVYQIRGLESNVVVVVWSD